VTEYVRLRKHAGSSNRAALFGPWIHAAPAQADNPQANTGQHTAMAHHNNHTTVKPTATDYGQVLRSSNTTHSTHHRIRIRVRDTRHPARLRLRCHAILLRARDTHHRARLRLRCHAILLRGRDTRQLRLGCHTARDTQQLRLGCHTARLRLRKHDGSSNRAALFSPWNQHHQRPLTTIFKHTHSTLPTRITQTLLP
jgi:hypothetical protein